MATSRDGDPGRGEIFDLLSNHRRRYAIHYCKSEEDSVALGDLAEQVAAWEESKAIEEITSAERKRVYTSLQQTHLPTLDRAGMVNFENGEVELTDRADELDVYLDVVPGDSIPWGMYYLGLSGLSLAVLGGIRAGVLPTETVSTLAWATLLVGVFAVSAVFHVYQNRMYRLGEVETPP